MYRKEKLNHMISVRCSDTDLIKMSILKSNWEKEDPDIKYNNSDILRLCMRVSYDLETNQYVKEIFDEHILNSI